MSNKTPVRIYVLWHEEFEEGIELARHIYHWFRLPSAEGIPVYPRAWNPEAIENSGRTELPDPIEEESCLHNYIFPLVENHMVASLDWRDTIREFAEKHENGQKRATGTNKKAKTHLFPIALDDNAYQLPDEVARLNFIRHTGWQEEEASERLLTRMTEVLCRSLRSELITADNTIPASKDPLASSPANQSITIFLSHAKADGTDVPRELKEYIQSQTQCNTFFDETDIPFGSKFADEISGSITTESAGLIVVQGNHYANRPWCREELRMFLEPRYVNSDDKKTGGVPPIISSMPLVVVTELKDGKPARTIPELGYATIVPWEPGNPRSAVVTMLREILFSVFYRFLCIRTASLLEENEDRKNQSIIMNFSPHPDQIEFSKQLIAGKSGRSLPAELTIFHPGHGLTEVEMGTLKERFRDIKFEGFGHSCTGFEMDRDLKKDTTSLSGEVLSVSAGNSPDLLHTGQLEEHVVELLYRSLEPLLKRQISILYGGSMPSLEEPDEPWKKPANFTTVFLNLLFSTRKRQSENGGAQAEDKKEKRIISRLFNLSAWQYTRFVTKVGEAQWINTCSFKKILQPEAGIPEEEVLPDTPTSDEEAARRDRNTAFCLTKMRKTLAEPIEWPIPENRKFSFQCIGHLFIGGKITGAAGAMAGIWEEALYALENGRPCFILSAAAGAAGMLAKWLLDPPTEIPRELTPEGFENDFSVYYENELKSWGHSDGIPTLLHPRLWDIINDTRKKGLGKVMNNGLSDDHNRQLMSSKNFSEIAYLLERGVLEVKKKKDQ
ncbi:MAG: hypothetical protein CMO55_25020 [Verrucomicrobiales bacterium]|nr:hypothetical protein [Verrucomicrobiales bacterium]